MYALFKFTLALRITKNLNDAYMFVGGCVSTYTLNISRDPFQDKTIQSSNDLRSTVILVVPDINI